MHRLILRKAQGLPRPYETTTDEDIEQMTCKNKTTWRWDETGSAKHLKTLKASLFVIFTRVVETVAADRLKENDA